VNFEYRGYAIPDYSSRLEYIGQITRIGRWDIPTTLADIPFIVMQAAKCLRLAKECCDAEISDQLFGLARAFAHRARILGADPATLEPFTAGVCTDVPGKPNFSDDFSELAQCRQFGNRTKVLRG
jgi:hypothetical protein